MHWRRMGFHMHHKFPMSDRYSPRIAHGWSLFGGRGGGDSPAAGGVGVCGAAGGWLWHLGFGL